MNTILVLLTVLSACLTKGKATRGGHCYDDNDLQKYKHFVGKHAWNNYPSFYMVKELEQLESGGKRQRRHTGHSCPNLVASSIQQVTEDHNTRSISPWRYTIDVDENRLPMKLAFAECLCSGCIDVRTGRETDAVNSVTVNQTMMVLRRKQCSDQKTYAFQVEYIKVPVACTCVLPKSHF
ncbi:interleukin-17C [Acipenser ruthenus]|uniref:interleukin-17C n=1 Tax=Acipenser ruthenus TaxID=7906 RepID=UPI00156055D4|nr:interleukin-17C [Acipenser ruthenus]